MHNENNDEKLERYLSEFQPRAVRPLAVKKPSITMLWLRRLAVAAVVLICAATGLHYWHNFHPHAIASNSKSTMHPAVPGKGLVDGNTHNVFALTRLALTDEAQFEAQLAEQSRAVLPNFRGKSTLQVFSKE